MQVAKAVEQFLEWVSVHRSPKTHKAYKQRINSLVQTLGTRSLSRLRPVDVDRFVAASQRAASGRRFAPDTIRLSIVAFEQFQKWAIRSGHLRQPIQARIPKPKGRLRQRIPSGEEQFAILANATRPFRLIFLALRISGARPSELTGADIAHYDRRQGLIVLDEHKTAGRTSQTRRIGVGHRLRELLDEATTGRTSGPLFLDERGLRWRMPQLSARYRRLRDKAGLSRELVLYSATRHEHGMRVTRQLGLFAANHSLGHRCLEATMRYTHADDRQLGGYQDQVYDL